MNDLLKNKTFSIEEWASIQVVRNGDVVLIGGDQAHQYSGENSIQVCGDCGVQIIEQDGYQKAGLDTLQIIVVRGVVSCRTVSGMDAGKWFEVANGTWLDCDAQTSAELDNAIETVRDRHEAMRQVA